MQVLNENEHIGVLLLGEARTSAVRESVVFCRTLAG